ncbi:hypothetical protein ES703_106604 [subsurface metagenome]
MTAATIVFIDIVGFSKCPSHVQRELVDSMTTEVVSRLRSLINPPMETAHVVAMPTGDGMALAFLHKANKPWDHSTILSFIYHMQEWASVKVIQSKAVSLRIGVHVGQVEFITDINQKPNICGDTINYTQRVMDAANPRQVLFSDSAFREYIGTAVSTYTDPPYSTNSKAEFEGPIEVHAKHGMRMLVYKMTLNPAQEWWSNDDPVSKDLMTVSLTTLPKEIVGSFSERVELAEDIALLQLTGDRFLKEFSVGHIKLSSDLRRLLVFMPSVEAYNYLHIPSPYPIVEYVNECIQEWKGFFTKISAQYQNATLKLGLFEEPPYFGASFLNWERKGGENPCEPVYLGSLSTGMSRI